MSDIYSAMAAALQQQFHARERTRIDVPEWTETPCNGVLYSKPYTIHDDQALGRYIQGNDSAGFVEIIIRKAELADGNMAFSKVDKPLLIRTCDASVIKRVAMEIVASISVEEASGN